jgi:hypothetical protein
MLVGIVRLKDYFLVVVELQPRKAVEDRACRLFRRAGKIGILDPQKELPALLPGVKVIK